MRARAGGRVADPAERVIDYMTALARDQDVHVVTLDAIIGACDVMPLKWPDLFEKHLTDMVEAVPGRDAYRLRKKRSDLMARLTDEERVVGHLLEVGVASPADIRRALSLAESDTKDILHRLAVDGRAQYEGRGRGVRWSLVETRPVPPPVEASPVVEERAVPATDAAAVAVATAHEFRAIAQALGLGPSATAGEVAETVRLWVADVGRVVALEKRVAELEALEGALQLTERERDEAREEAAGWKASAERAMAAGQTTAYRLEGKRLEVLDWQLRHAELLASVVELEAERDALRGRLVETDGRIPYEMLEGRLAHYRRAWCDLAAAVTGTPTDPDGGHGELEVGGVLAMATRLRADADTAADLPAIIDRLAKERDEARARRNELERRAEATNTALCDLRRKARRKLDRARDRLADAENSLNTIEMVPLASADIPF